MDIATQMIGQAGVYFQFGIFKLQLYKAPLMMIFSPYIKISGLFFTGLYYHSYMTSLISKVKSSMPNSVNAKIQAARDFMKMPHNSKMHEMMLLPPVYQLGNASTLLEEVKGDRNGITESEQNIHSDKKAQFNNIIHDFDSTSVDVIEVTMNDLKQFKDEMVDDFQTGVLGGTEKAGLKYLDLTFREPIVHRAILDVLESSLKEDSFVRESREYGIDLINDVVKDSEFQNELKKTTLSIVKDDDVKQASVDLLKHCVNHNTIQFFVKKLNTEVMTQTYAKDALIQTLTEGVIRAVQKPETTKHLGNLFNTVAAIDVVKNEATNSIVYKNLYECFSFQKSTKSKEEGFNSLIEEKIDSWLKERSAF